VCHNSRGDLDVIRCAPGDQARLVLRPSVKILEVEAEIVQSVSDSLEHGVAGYLGQLLVKAGVENAESNGIILNRLMREDLRYSAGGRLLCLTRRVREVKTAHRLIDDQMRAALPFDAPWYTRRTNSYQFVAIQWLVPANVPVVM
jgi:hypothetical protein